MILFFLVPPHGLQGLSSLTRDQTRGPLQWNRRVLTSGPPGNYPKLSVILSIELILKQVHLLLAWGIKDLCGGPVCYLVLSNFYIPSLSLLLKSQLSSVTWYHKYHLKKVYLPFPYLLLPLLLRIHGREVLKRLLKKKTSLKDYCTVQLLTVRKNLPLSLAGYK